MGFVSKIWNFVSNAMLSSEDKVNALSSAIVAACDTTVREGERLERFETVVKRYEIDYTSILDFLNMRLGEGNASANEFLCNNIVAASNKLLALMGYDPTRYSSLGQKEARAMAESCMLQRAKIDRANIDELTMKTALKQVAQIKRRWHAQGDPRWELCRITELELWAEEA